MVSKLFYPKLACTNLFNNRQTVLPFSLASMSTIAMFYMMNAITVNIGINKMSGADSIQMILKMGTIVVGIFSTIFLFYTNSFLMKRRKKEVGLYNILGMEKKHIAKMLSFETGLIGLICIILGLVSGVLLSRLIFLLLLKMLHFKVPFVFNISLVSIKLTVLLFGGIFLLTLVTNLMHIHLSKPIELLKGGQVGEREPKTKWLLTILGLLSLGAGYGIAIVVKKPLMAISLFFVAALLVIFGTYALFTAGSILVLKKLRKNKGFYYQTKHFTAISGMIYRMKRNAVGLSNICILSSAVLVMISTSVCLYVGVEDVLELRFPRDILVQYQNAPVEESEKLDQLIAENMEKSAITMEQVFAYHYAIVFMQRDDQIFTAVDDLTYSPDLYITTFLTVAQYNKMENKEVQLERNEVLLYASGEAYGQEIMVINNQQYVVKEELKTLEIEEQNPVVNVYYIIVRDEATIYAIYEQSKNEKKEHLDYLIGFNLEGEEDEKLAFINNIKKAIYGQMESDVYFESRELSRSSFYDMHGGLLFLGLFLGTLFLMATALIIYYKQISEGYDDQERYAIMQKVGLSRQEVKRSIKSQIIMVFFLPLIAAIIHIAVAFKMITRLLLVLGLANISLFFLCTIGTIFVFALIYLCVYRLTAGAYYKIVK